MITWPYHAWIAWVVFRSHIVSEASHVMLLLSVVLCYLCQLITHTTTPTQVSTAVITLFPWCHTILNLFLYCLNFFITVYSNCKDSVISWRIFYIICKKTLVLRNNVLQFRQWYFLPTMRFTVSSGLNHLFFGCTSL